MSQFKAKMHQLNSISGVCLFVCLFLTRGMQTNVAVGLTSLKNQIQASGAERRKLNCPQNAPKAAIWRSKFENFSGEGAHPQWQGGYPLFTPYPFRRLRRLDPRAYGPRTRRLRRLVLGVPLPLILQFDH